jgi:hypothetical protein
MQVFSPGNFPSLGEKTSLTTPLLGEVSSNLEDVFSEYHLFEWFFHLKAKNVAATPFLCYTDIR